MTSKSQVRATRRTVVQGTAAVLAGAMPLLSACNRRGALKIGFLGPMSGRGADLGVSGRNGAQLAVDDVNAAGGVGGRLLDLVAKDDEQKPEVARDQLRAFARDGVSLIVGPMTSAIAIAVRALAGELGIVLISPTASAPDLVGQDDALICLAPNAAASATQHAQWLFQQGFRRISSLADTQNKAYSQSWVRAARARWSSLGGQWLDEHQFESSPAVAYGELSQALVQRGPEVVLLVASATDSAMLAQQIRRRNEQVAISVTPWAANDPFIPMGGRAVEGAWVMQLLDRGSTSAAYLQFERRYRERFGEAPGYRAIKAHDAVMLGVHGLRQGGTLRDALVSVRRFPGLQQEFTLDQYGDSAAPLYATRVRQGVFEPWGPVPVGVAASAASTAS